MPLSIAGAYHSRLMEPARAQFAAFLADVEFRAPRFTVISNTTAQPVTEPAAIREALIKQVVSPVRWEECMREAINRGATELLELGMGGVLCGLARRTDKSWPSRALAEFTDLAL